MEGPKRGGKVEKPGLGRMKFISQKERVGKAMTENS